MHGHKIRPKNEPQAVFEFHAGLNKEKSNHFQSILSRLFINYHDGKIESHKAFTLVNWDGKA